jgi:hypothetical protein
MEAMVGRVSAPYEKCQPMERNPLLLLLMKPLRRTLFTKSATVADSDGDGTETIQTE